jgi:hypothetical protein
MEKTERGGFATGCPRPQTGGAGVRSELARNASVSLVASPTSSPSPLCGRRSPSPRSIPRALDPVRSSDAPILAEVEHVTLDTVRLWGRFSARRFAGDHPELVAPNEPLESLMRLKVLLSTLFDFTAFDIPMLTEGYAELAITYHMGPRADEAACHQTLGFTEEVLSLAGARVVRDVSRERVERRTADRRGA